METTELILLGLCLWASVATGLALYYGKRFIACKLVILVLGKELYEIAHGELEVKVVNGEVVRTKLKEKPNGV